MWGDSSEGRLAGVKITYWQLPSYLLTSKWVCHNLFMVDVWCYEMQSLGHLPQLGLDPDASFLGWWSQRSYVAKIHKTGEYYQYYHCEVVLYTCRKSPQSSGTVVFRAIVHPLIPCCGTRWHLPHRVMTIDRTGPER